MNMYLLIFAYMNLSLDDLGTITIMLQNTPVIAFNLSRLFHAGHFWHIIEASAGR